MPWPNYPTALHNLKVPREFIPQWLLLMRIAVEQIDGSIPSPAKDHTHLADTHT